VILFASILGLMVGSSAPASYSAPAITAASGQLMSAGATNTSGPFTNRGVVFSSNAITGAIEGQQWAVNWGTNPAPLSVDVFAANVAGYVGGQTVWRTNGTWTARASYPSGQAVGLSVACAVASVGDGFFLTFSNYAAGTLGEHCLTNIQARTNAGKTGVLFSGRSTNGWAWSAGSLLSGVTGATGLSMPTNSWTLTAITPRHAYTAAHQFPGVAVTNGVYVGSVIKFVGTDGATNAATVTASRRRYSDNGFPAEDYTLVIFSADLPATVEPVRVAWATNIAAKLISEPVANLNVPLPRLETCQHGRVGSQVITLFDGHAMHVGGDSGNPAFLIVSNAIVNYGGTSGSLLSAQFLADLEALTVGAGLATNDFWPVIDSLSAFPDL